MKTEMKPGRQPPAIFQQSRRMRRPRSSDTERVRALLNRLQTIVPAAPKDRQLPQVQVIQHVINYICQLQDQVVRHPRLGKMVTASETAREDGEASRVPRAVGEVDGEENKEADREEAREDGESASEAGGVMDSEAVTLDRAQVRCSPSTPTSGGTPPV